MAGGVKFTMLPSGAAEVTLNQPGGPMDRYIEGVARRTRDIAREEAPVDTGELRDSIELERAGPSKWRIVANAKHARYVIKGTAPHQIRAKGKSLVFVPRAGGDVVFAKSVQHPGTRPNDFLTRALKRAV